MYIYICIRTHKYVYIYIFTSHTVAHTHTHMYLYIYTYICTRYYSQASFMWSAKASEVLAPRFYLRTLRSSCQRAPRPLRPRRSAMDRTWIGCDFGDFWNSWRYERNWKDMISPDKIWKDYWRFMSKTAGSAWYPSVCLVFSGGFLWENWPCFLLHPKDANVVESGPAEFQHVTVARRVFGHPVDISQLPLAPAWRDSMTQGFRQKNGIEWDRMAGWWFGTFFIFPYIGLLIIPIDFHIFQRGGYTTTRWDWLSPNLLQKKNTQKQ